MQKSNYKLSQLTAKKTQANSIFTLSIKSKQKPFGLSQHKQEQENQLQNESHQVMYFPTEEFKGFLKGEKIYLECYYKDKIFSSGYEPYIQAMGGQVMKRLGPTTTVILTNQMTLQKYQKLKSRVAKTCRPEIFIVSILWIQQIYRQKRKVQKQPYLFDERTDIVDWKQHQASQQDEPFPDYFQREIFKKDFFNELDEYLKNPDQDMKFRMSQNNRKMKKQDFNNPHILWIMPQKFNVFENQEQEQKYKQLAKTHKNPKINYQKNDKKKQQKPGQQANKRATVYIGQKQQRRRTSSRRSQKMQIQNKLQSKKQEIQSKKVQEKKQKQQKQQEYKQSDSEFLRRIRQKKQVVQQQSINTILDKYLNKADVKVSKEQKRLTDIQQLVSAENYSNDLFVEQRFSAKKNPYKQQLINEFDKQNSQSGNQNELGQNENLRRGSFTKSTKKSRPQHQRKSVVFTQQKRKQIHSFETGPKSQIYSKTRSLGKSSNPKRQKRFSQLMNQFRVDIDEFLQNVGYIRDSEEFQMRNKNFKSTNKHQKIIYNIIVKQPYIISRVNDFNNAVRDKINAQNKVYFNLIDFQSWNKHLVKTPLLKFFINFKDLTEDIKGKQEKSKKIQTIKQLFEMQEVDEQTAISNYEVMCELVSSEDYRDLDFYFLCNKKNKQEVLMGYLSKVQKKNILEYNVLKSIFDLLSKKQSKSQQLSQSSQSFTKSMISDTNSIKSKQESLKLKIQRQIFINHRIKAKLTLQKNSGKKITCIPIKLQKNVQFIAKKSKARFIPLQFYMNNKQNVDIVINDKRTFSKVKNVWYPDYQTFISSLIVIE